MNYLDVGYNQFLDKSIVSGAGIADLDFDSQFDSISGDKIGGGVSRSSNDVVQIDWENGLITINFPPGGSLKLGAVGSDSSGNALYGLILNDGVTNRVFEGYQAQGF